MVLSTSFPSAEAMDQLLAMGMREGLTAAVGQTDDLLAGAPQRSTTPLSTATLLAGSTCTRTGDQIDSGVGGAHVRTARARSRLRRRRPARACEGPGLPDTAAGAGAGSARRSGSRSRPRPWLPTNRELTDLERTDFHLAGAQSAHHRISNREAADRERPHCRGSQRQRRHDRRCDGSRSDDLRADEAAADGGSVGPVPNALRPIHDGSLSSISVSFRAGATLGGCRALRRYPLPAKYR